MILDVCYAGTVFEEGGCNEPESVKIPLENPLFSTPFIESLHSNLLTKKTNIFISSSTNQIASDGNGVNSPFSKLFIKFLTTNSSPVSDNVYLQESLSVEKLLAENAISFPKFCSYSCENSKSNRFLFVKK